MPKLRSLVAGIVVALIVGGLFAAVRRSDCVFDGCYPMSLWMRFGLPLSAGVVMVALSEFFAKSEGKK